MTLRQKHDRLQLGRLKAPLRTFNVRSRQFVLSDASGLFTLIWNWLLLTISSTMAEKRLSSFAAVRAIARTVGMSVYSRPRPSAYVIVFSMNMRTNCGE